MDLEREYLRGARRKAREARSYFDDDDDDDYGDGGANASSHPRTAAVAEQADDDVDPLDAFMIGIESQVAHERTQQPAAPKPDVLNHGDEADAYMADSARGQADDSDDEVYAAAKRADPDDDDGALDGKKVMEVLAPVDHSRVQYETFRKGFYAPHADIQSMSDAEVAELRRELSVRADGADAPRPIRSFVQLGFDRKMLGQLMKLGLEAPTAIQAQAFPVALSGRDLIGIAKTGSGKTLAFTLPMVRHVMDQRALRKDEGPIAVVLSPTRELAHQIFVQVKKFVSIYGAECAAIYGGVGKWEQIQAVRKGAEVVVATPGRLIEMIRKKTVKMNRVTFVVLDEADRMFEMGFEPQLRSVMGQVRPDRQTLMFSATFRRRIEALALDILDNPVKVTVGKIGQANEDIHQIAVVLPNENAKWPWLMENLKKIADEGRVLIFAGSKLGCETLTKNLNAMGFPSWCLHGDKTQRERADALAKFRSGECRILVATDVAARGLDVKDVKSVVNFDVAKNIDIHVHRIGRTGRMGHDGFEPGTAYTLVTTKESNFASQLVHNMDVSGQVVAADLLALAKKDPRFRRGTPAAHSARSNASAMPVHQESKVVHSAVDRIEDEEDAQEMERWNESQRKRTADQRQGLGFSGASARDGRGSQFAAMGRGAGKSSAAALSSSFQSAFVKASSAAAAPVSSSSIPSKDAARFSAPPPPPPPPSQAMPRSESEIRVPPPLPPAFPASVLGGVSGALSRASIPSPLQPSHSSLPVTTPANYGALPVPAAPMPVVPSTESLEHTETSAGDVTNGSHSAVTSIASALPRDVHGASEVTKPTEISRSEVLEERGRDSNERAQRRSSSKPASSSESPQRRRSSSSRRRGRSRSRSRSRNRRRRSRSDSRERYHRRRRRSPSRSRSVSRSRSRSRGRDRKRGRRYSRSRSRSHDSRSRRYR